MIPLRLLALLLPSLASACRATSYFAATTPRPDLRRNARDNNDRQKHNVDLDALGLVSPSLATRSRRSGDSRRGFILNDTNKVNAFG